MYQGKWSISNRDLERDILQMCKAEGMGIAPWGVFAQGMLKTDEEIKKNEQTGKRGRIARSGRGARVRRDERGCR